jgi:hypothetical protein
MLYTAEAVGLLAAITGTAENASRATTIAINIFFFTICTSHIQNTIIIILFLNIKVKRLQKLSHIKSNSSAHSSKVLRISFAAMAHHI